MNYLAPAMSGLFLVSAFLQLNDPDSVPWIVLYLAAAVASFRHKNLAPELLLSGVALCVLMAGYLMLAIDGIEWRAVFSSFNMQGQGVEEVREAGGLLIIASWFTILVCLNKREDTA